MNAVAPYFEDLRQGQTIDTAPALTLNEGHAAVHQAIVGDRLRLALDADLCRAVLGSERPMAHPALVCDVAIGQSTLVTRRVIANLFYRGLAMRRMPLIGDTLRTTTEVVALRRNSDRPGRQATGLAVLRVRTVDQEARPVLDFWRCAMLPLREPERSSAHDDDLDSFPSELDMAAVGELAGTIDFESFRAVVPGPHSEPLESGSVIEVAGGDVVSAAPELARMGLNVAIAHHDATVNGSRLVYGGHTIGIAGSQVSRALPNLVTVLAWHSCDHLGPVYEGDTLRSAVEIEGVEPLASGGNLVDLRSRVSAAGDSGTRDVLDWRFVGVMA